MSTPNERQKRMSMRYRAIRELLVDMTNWIVINAYHTKKCNDETQDSCICGLGELLETFDYEQHYFTSSGKFKKSRTSSEDIFLPSK